MTSMISWCFLGLFLQAFVHEIGADVYFHIPRGSNNRLLGENANRQNANRVFDSQNNAKGGYNAPEKTEKKTTDWYHMQYFMSSAGVSNNGRTILSLEWTNQHGCGDGDLNCNIVVQYQCRPSPQADATREIRNGKSEATPRYGKRNYRNRNDKERHRKGQARVDRALNEQWEWYDKCNTRQRNSGLFTADQNLKGSTSRYTRQNPNGNRYGYECPEERDYYPYFHPTDWIDIAVLGKGSDCKYYRSESFNVKPKGECMELYNKNAEYQEGVNTYRHASKYNNKADCEKNSGRWVMFHNYLEEIDVEKSKCTRLPNGRRLIWGIPYRSENLDQFKGSDPEKWKRCLVALGAPECRPAPHSRSNHLGNGVRVTSLSYPWKLPHFPSGVEQKCVLRIRYNISTNDYDPKKTFADSNNEKSPIKNDPQVKFGKAGDNKIPLQLAINTAQFGRTFQDRSHTFKIVPRQKHFEGKTIRNLNVRGKRGNIVQVYPAVEYDFSPKRIWMKSSDLLHVQWGGSNRNPANNAGEGRAQTDRSNLVTMQLPDRSFPRYFPAFLDHVKVVHALVGRQDMTPADAAIAMATAGQFTDATKVPANLKLPGCANQQQVAQLDCYPPSYPGLLLQFNMGSYYYMCSRNNNFTNRSQKGRLHVQG